MLTFDNVLKLHKRRFAPQHLDQTIKRSSTLVLMTKQLGWFDITACYHEPKVHDHDLYFQLTNINIYILVPLALFGLFFNAFALICLHSPPKITSGVFIYLKILLVLDHCHIIVTSATILLPQLCDHHHSKEHLFYGFCMFERRFLKYTMPRLESTVNILHVWTISSLAVHRYWKISRPVVSRFKDTSKRARSVLLIMFAIALLFRLPIFFFELDFKFKPTWRIVRRPETTELLSPYRLVYHTFLDPLITNVLPFVWMCVFSLFTLFEIAKNRHFGYAKFSTDANGSSSSRASSFKRHSCTRPLMGGRRSSSTDKESIKSSMIQPLTYLRRRADNIRQKQEFRASVSIILIILLYLLFHSLQVYNVVRKWQLILMEQCPKRFDYFRSHISTIMSILSATVNAFVFIAFTNRLRHYVQMLIRKTSRSFSSSEAPLSPKIANNSTDAMLV